MMSTCPLVTGSYEPGQMAVPFRLGDTVDGDERVAVGPLVGEREGEAQRVALVGFGHDEGVFGEEGGQGLGELAREPTRGTIWRVDEHEVERAARLAQPRERIGPDEL